jgi:hypothetical protein
MEALCLINDSCVAAELSMMQKPDNPGPALPLLKGISLTTVIQ